MGAADVSADQTVAVRCICPSETDCRHPYPCPTPITDDRWGSWCALCNERRFARIDRGLATIEEALS